ncbi:FixH family protein [Alteraurantiacibacter aquimixticola]|uniref:Nitrogen fixation protein FixH n=1 Tax=Alteraurantiacibacter aquimixticola TaxID=2489173 RepID=A0A4V4U8Z8_9SPHN|nr:FixH family protein [Alteraurantiacibacter aquimixticola]TIX51987.1 hypothetical protein E5222_06030 [Alteraurantiacibacter aquimixticola]
MERRFTGWHMAAMMVAFFGVVIAVNVTMARIAIGSFGGVVVENSYVASQEFNGWLKQAEEQSKLGWDVSTTRDEMGLVHVDVTGAPDALAVTANARHPLGSQPDRPLTFARVSEGHYVATEPLPGGRWILRLQLAAGSDQWRSEDELP